MKYKERVLVPEDDTHKQTITDVYKIFKTSYSKCYDSEEEMFFCDVVHHLEQHSASTKSETDSFNKYKVEDSSLKEAINNIPKWITSLPKNYGVNVSTSLTCKEGEPEFSPLHYIENMGVEMIEYVKLRIGYNFLKSNLRKKSTDERYNKSICPGLTGGMEDPIVLRMLYMQYINSDDYLKWILRSRKKEEPKKKDVKSKSEESTSGALKVAKSDSGWKFPNVAPSNRSFSMKEDDLKNLSIDSQLTNDKSVKEELPPLTADEKKHIIMLTQYEVMDQELPDDIEVFWPGKRDLENDFNNFKNALSENILHRQFIQKFKSGKLERLDEDVWLECKEYFLETARCHDGDVPLVNLKSEYSETEVPISRERCSWDKLKERFRDYTITQEATLSLFDNMIKEKTRLENLNLCCIISKLKEIHKETSQEEENDGELIWRDIVVMRKINGETEEVLAEMVGDEETIDTQGKTFNDLEKEYHVLPEYKSLIYVSEVLPKPGQSYIQDKCQADACCQGKMKVINNGLKGGCTGYSMTDFKTPQKPECWKKASLRFNDGPDEEKALNGSPFSQGDSDNSFLSLYSFLPNKKDYVTFHTDWSNYPYSEMLDIVFHRHHRGYIYITDVFEIKPDTLREIRRIFHKTGKWSEEESNFYAISSNACKDQRTRFPCCSQPIDENNFPFTPSMKLTSLGEDRMTTVRKGTWNSQASHMHQPSEAITMCFPNLQDIEKINIQNLQVERDLDNPSDSQTSSDEIDNVYDRDVFLERFKSSEVSSTSFDNHNVEVQELERDYPVCIDYNDNLLDDTMRISRDDDDYSDIVDFIKNFRFGEERKKIPTNYEVTHMEEDKNAQGILIDLFPPENEQTAIDQPLKPDHPCDDRSIDSESSFSLRDIKGLAGDNDECSHCQAEQDISVTASLGKVEAPRLEHKVSGDLYDNIVTKRRFVLQELRASFPLVYLYLNLKTNFSKLNITGKLAIYKKYFLNIDSEYQDILAKYNLNADGKSITTKDFVKHRHLVYEDVFGKYKSFNFETCAMALCDGFIRHLIIREAFQDVGTNLSFFLLQFIENDRYNLLYAQNKKETMYCNRIINDVCQFLNNYREDEKYKRFLFEVVILHYFETKRYFTLNELIKLDLNWEEILQIPRTIILEDEGNATVNITYKDSIVQSCQGYSYLFYLLVKQLNHLYQVDDTFRQLLEPELHPKRIQQMDCSQMDEAIQKNSLELCDTILVKQIEIDMACIMQTVWTCEILGINQCGLNSLKLCNKFPDETLNYFATFFPTVIRAEGGNGPTDSNVWKYNRQFHFWSNKEGGKPKDSFLTRNNLFIFEGLITKCFVKSVLTFYKYTFHG